MSKEEFIPYIPADKVVDEFTFKSVFLGVVLAIVMCAANTYLGLKVGMTVSASIPAAVISMGILRGILRRGTILENNIVQTIASSGEALAAGIIFTVPAFVIAGVWDKFEFWPTVIIAILGGFFGILFMIPLRRALIVNEKSLTFPEGVACAEVLKVGETGGRGFTLIIWGVATGLIFQFLSKGVSVLKSSVDVAWSGTNKAIYFAGSEVSLALISVGYIVGLNVASLVFLGGIIGWVIALPIISAAHPVIPGPEDVLNSAYWADQASAVWSSKIRYIGVGAMVVGGLWSIFCIRKGVAESLRGTLAGFRTGLKGAATSSVRTDRDLEFPYLWGIFIVMTILTAGFYVVLTNLAIGLVATVLMIIAAFFFVAVAAYIVGMVGSSNSPVSGMTICTLLFASMILLLFGMKGEQGIIAALGIAGVVCCAACSSGDICQDLKTGYLVGATPRWQQISEFIGAFCPAFIIPPVLFLLHSAYGIGIQVKEGVEPLAAPQAGLFASITKMLFTPGQSLPWGMVITGVVVGVIIVILDEILKAFKAPFRLYIMAVAVGIYLPMALSVPIFLGGLINLLVYRLMVGRGVEKVFAGIHRGVVLASGLIAGEAIMGILIAIPITLGVAMPFKSIAGFNFTEHPSLMTFLSIAAMALVVFMFFSICLKDTDKAKG